MEKCEATREEMGKAEFLRERKRTGSNEKDKKRKTEEDPGEKDRGGA